MDKKLIYTLRNAKINVWPFPHFFVTGVFQNFDSLVLKLPDGDRYDNATYPNRKICMEPDLGRLGLEYMRTKEFLIHVLKIFKPFIKPSKDGFTYDVRLVLDLKGYSIGPHTDHPNKVVSLLFYLPRDNLFFDEGTSIFVHNKGETCEGGPHYTFDDFTEVHRAPYIPNSCFGFLKTVNSWHGVFPIRNTNRNVLLYNIYRVPNGDDGERD